MTMSEVEQLLDGAFSAYEEGRLAEAEDLCRQVLARQPGDALALHLLGVVAGRTGRTELGIALLREVVGVEPGGVEPELVDALNDLGQLLTEDRQISEAISVLEGAVRLEPDSAGARNNLGQAYLAQGRTGEAIASLERALALAPEVATIHYNLGTALQAHALSAEAAASFHCAIPLAPNFPQAQARLCDVLRDVGEASATPRL